MAEIKNKAAPAAKASTKVKVVAVRQFFVDLNSNTVIGKEPVELELDGWLQAQIDAGWLAVV